MDDKDTTLLITPGQGNSYRKETGKWQSFVLGMAMALVCGTLYGFGSFQTDLKKSMSLSQSQMEMMGISMHVGLYLFKPVGGVFYDKFGPRPTAFLAAVFGGAGYFMVSQTCSKTHTSLSLATTMLGFAFVGVGSGLGFITALTTNARNFDASTRGRVVGSISSAFGLSATLVSLTYMQSRNVFPNSSRLSWFFVCLAVLMAVACVLGALFVKRVVTDVATVVPQKQHHSVNMSESAVDGNEDLSLGWTARPVGLWCALSHLCTDVRFWLFYLLFFIGCGCGLFVINNVGTMHQSLSGSTHHGTVQIIVIVLALSNCFGRLFVGFVSDLVEIHRRFFLAFSLALMSITLAVTLAIPYGSANLLFFTVVGVGFGYGGIWAAVPTILSETYGLPNFGKVYGLVATAPALASTVFNEISATIYEHHTSGSDDKCFGRGCYAWSFAITAICGVLATVITVQLKLRSPAISQALLSSV